jgi:BASS family bile acid:Na+ symporter
MLKERRTTMDPKTLAPLLVHASLLLLVAGIGLRSRWEDLTTALRHPRLLLRGVVAVNLVVPLVALLAMLALPISPAIKAGVVLMAVSPMAPFAPGKMLKAGAENAFVVGIYVALIVLAVAIVPATVAVLSATLPGDVTIPVGAVAWLVLTSVLAPLGAGLLVAHFLPRWAERLARMANILAYVILVPFVALLLYKSGGAMLALVGDGVLVAIIATVAAGLAAGHLLGGPEPSHRMALALAAATRHPGIAGLIAHSHFDNPQVMLAVVLFLVTSLVVSGAYTAWAARRFAAQVPSGA